MQDVIAAAKARPAGVSFGSSGNGTSQHLSGELFASMAGLKLLHVPFKGSSPAVQALLGNQADMVFENSIAAVPLIRAGKLRALASTGPRRGSARSMGLASCAGMPCCATRRWSAR